VVHDGLYGLPEWLVVGLLAGLACSVVAAILFYVADRRFPAPADQGAGHADETRRRAELRTYLDAIEERYVEEATVAGQRVAFYLPGRDVAVTFDPRAYYRIDRTDTYAILFEHEMPGSHLGDRLPFEVPDVGVGGEASGDSVAGGGVEQREGGAAAAFAELGVDADADLAEVRTAYRERVKEVHPDQGGDEASFQRVQEAYATAKEHAR
jgi:hypothetical protein